MDTQVRPLNLVELERPALEAALEARGHRRFHARQIFGWIYRLGVSDVAQMTDLSRDLRAMLADEFVVTTPALIDREQSIDGTEKFLLRFADGRTVESVYIPDTPSNTFCVSTQVGCAMACAFCLTGRMGLVRNLTAGEIVGQVRVLADALQMRGVIDPGGFAPADPPRLRSRGPGAPLCSGPHARLPRVGPGSGGRACGAPRFNSFNIVLMGMGEPLHNYDATMKALRILADEYGFNLSPRRITLSTVGLLPALEKLAHEPIMPNLAISLHAPTDAQRGELVPLNRKYGVGEIIAACKRFPLRRRHRITFEYVLLSGVNDRPEDARRLAKLLAGVKSKVNLIPLNAAPGIPFERPSDETVDRFARILADHDLLVSVRKSRGRDILAACGQLIVDSDRKSPAQQLALTM